MANVLIMEDHPLFREALKGTVGRILPDFEIHEASTLQEAVDRIKEVGRFNLAVLDLMVPDITGFEGILTLRKLFPTLPMLVISAQDDHRLVKEALNYGAAGFVPKSSDQEQIALAIREVLAGNIFVPETSKNDVYDHDKAGELSSRLRSLTKQQVVVLKMLKLGRLNKQIAYDLDLSETTVKAHVSEILRKLGVGNRTQAVIEMGKIDFDYIIGEHRDS